MRLLATTTRTLFLATLLGAALLATADHEKAHARDQDVETVETAEMEPHRGGDDPAMQEVRACIGPSCTLLGWVVLCVSEGALPCL